MKSISKELVRQKSTYLTAASCCLVLLYVIGQAAGAEEELIRTKRHEPRTATSAANDNRQEARVSVTAAATATSMAGGVPAAPKQARPSATSAASSVEDLEPDEESARPGKKQVKLSRGPKGGRHLPRGSQQDRDDTYDNRRRDEEADCDEDEQDTYGNSMFQSMASNPMRHFRRMMNNVFDRIPNFYGDEDGDDDGGYGFGSDRLGGGSVASSAAAFSDSRDGGYSKLSSSVTSNGRTRGIISETRNGRTKTRRVGDDDRDEADE